MKKNYVIMNATVYARKNSRGVYHWVMGELFNYAQPDKNPNQLPVMAITREEEAVKFLKCSREMTAEERTQRGVPQDTKAYIFDYSKAVEAIKNEKFADGTACGYVFMDPITFEEIKKKDIFTVKTDVEAFDVPLMRPVARVATRPMTVKVNGVDRTIAVGQKIPGKNGEIVPITSLRLYAQVDEDGKPIENLEDMKNRMLERRYVFMDETPQGAPGAAPAQTQPAGQTPEQAQTQQAAAAAAAALGSGVTPF